MVATATTAVVTAVTTTAVSGTGTCISNTGIFRDGVAGCSSVVSFSTPSGASKSLGGITIGTYPGIRAVGGLNSISITGNSLGSSAVGRFKDTTELLS